VLTPQKCPIHPGKALCSRIVDVFYMVAVVMLCCADTRSTFLGSRPVVVLKHRNLVAESAKQISTITFRVNSYHGLVVKAPWWRVIIGVVGGAAVISLAMYMLSTIR
jgi:hypothetical protein